MFSIMAPMADPSAVAGVELIVNLATRMTDPERRAFREDTERWLAAGKKLQELRKAHDVKERQLRDREADLAAREAAAARRETELAEREVQIADSRSNLRYQSPFARPLRHQLPRP
jgi:hypothetical protein